MLTTVMRVSKYRNASLGPRAVVKQEPYNAYGVTINVIEDRSDEGFTTVIPEKPAAFSTVDNSFYIASGEVSFYQESTPLNLIPSSNVNAFDCEPAVAFVTYVEDKPIFSLEVTDA